VAARQGTKSFLTRTSVSEALPHLSFPTPDAGDKKFNSRPVVPTIVKPNVDGASRDFGAGVPLCINALAIAIYSVI
jgi:hypothetical protein